ncbi:MAG: hypothetical protein NUK63_09380 [Candidatus Bathyarchaeum tardum]|nr:MAG: hypothetical protein NUK63_09380 [Candidatus Bathyarchaeum tardum]
MTKLTKVKLTVTITPEIFKWMDEKIKKGFLRRQEPRSPVLTNESQRTNQKGRNQVLTSFMSS